jgi:hypothetical protein
VAQVIYPTEHFTKGSSFNWSWYVCTYFSVMFYSYVPLIASHVFTVYWSDTHYNISLCYTRIKFIIAREIKPVGVSQGKYFLEDEPSLWIHTINYCPFVEIVFLYSRINQQMIDFSLRNLNFPLNELHKITIGIVFIQRENSSSKKIFTFRNTNWLSYR